MDLAVVDGEVLCQDGRLFDRVAYSHFKYGWTPPAIGYGLGLASLVGDRLFQLAGKEPIAVVSAPYKHLPTASHVVAQSLLQKLSYRAITVGREPPLLLPFHKARAGSSSYAKSSAADRLKSLATLGLRIDESHVPGSHVLVVDDIRVTGSAQRATAAYLEPLQPASIWYLHAARLPEDVGRANPGLEDALNQTVEHTFEVILEQQGRGEFRLNTRVLRLILEVQNADKFRSFVEAAPLTLLEEIHQAGVGNGVAYYERYHGNLEAVYDFLCQRNPYSRSKEVASTC
jgi:hypothetical protein